MSSNSIEPNIKFSQGDLAYLYPYDWAVGKVLEEALFKFVHFVWVTKSYENVYCTNLLFIVFTYHICFFCLLILIVPTVLLLRKYHDFTWFCLLKIVVPNKKNVKIYVL